MRYTGTWIVLTLFVAIFSWIFGWSFAPANPELSWRLAAGLFVLGEGFNTLLWVTLR